MRGEKREWNNQWARFPIPRSSLIYGGDTLTIPILMEMKTEQSSTCRRTEITIHTSNSEAPRHPQMHVILCIQAEK